MNQWLAVRFEGLGREAGEPVVAVNDIVLDGLFRDKLSNLPGEWKSVGSKLDLVEESFGTGWNWV